VSSPAAAWLEKLESSSFLTPALLAVTHLECGGKQRATPLSVCPTPPSNSKFRSTGRDDFHVVPLFAFPLTQTHRAYQESLLLPRDGFASLRGGHNFPLIPGFSRLFPCIPGYFYAQKQVNPFGHNHFSSSVSIFRKFFQKNTSRAGRARLLSSRVLCFSGKLFPSGTPSSFIPRNFWILFLFQIASPFQATGNIKA
jgi:hypothetical protein